jgi:ABC-type Fe3+ transport system permease subunit
MKAKYFLPLLGFAVPTVVIGYGFVIPASCIAGLNQLTIGFAFTVVGACVTYWAGVRGVWKDLGSPGS